jgi:hypothetical protein
MRVFLLHHVVHFYTLSTSETLQIKEKLFSCFIIFDLLLANSLIFKKKLRYNNVAT